MSGSLGSRIRTLRLGKGMTQRELAVAVDVHEKYVQRWEGDHYRPSLDNAARLAKVLGTTIDALIEGEAAADGLEAEARRAERAARDERLRRGGSPPRGGRG